VLIGGCGFHRKKYENPITKETEQPDEYGRLVRTI
jgi:hypothetical protein